MQHNKSFCVGTYGMQGVGHGAEVKAACLESRSPLVQPRSGIQVSMNETDQNRLKKNCRTYWCKDLLVIFDTFPMCSTTNHFVWVLMECRAWAMVQRLKLPAWKVGVRWFNPALAFKFRRNKMFLPCSLVKNQYCAEPL